MALLVDHSGMIVVLDMGKGGDARDQRESILSSKHLCLSTFFTACIEGQQRPKRRWLYRIAVPLRRETNSQGIPAVHYEDRVTLLPSLFEGLSSHSRAGSTSLSLSACRSNNHIILTAFERPTTSPPVAFLRALPSDRKHSLRPPPSQLSFPDSCLALKRLFLRRKVRPAVRRQLRWRAEGGTPLSSARREECGLAVEGSTAA